MNKATSAYLNRPPRTLAEAEAARERPELRRAFLALSVRRAIAQGHLTPAEAYAILVDSRFIGES